MLITSKQQGNQQQTVKLSNHNSFSSSSSPVPPPIPPRSSTISATSSFLRGSSSIMLPSSDRRSSATSVAQTNESVLTSNLSLSNLGANKGAVNVDSRISSCESLHSIGNFRLDLRNPLNAPILNVTVSSMNTRNSGSSSRPGYLSYY